MGKSTVSMAIFDSYVSHYQRVNIIATVLVPRHRVSRVATFRKSGPTVCVAFFFHMASQTIWSTFLATQLGTCGVTISGLLIGYPLVN